MLKKAVSIFFTVLFLGIILAPTIIVLMDDSIDISIVFSTSKEEEKEKEKDLNIEVFVSKTKTNESYLFFESSENNLGYFNKKYTKPHLNIISPPPELGIS